MHLIVLLRHVGQVEAPFGSFRDSVNLNARYTACAERAIGSKIISGTTDRTPK
jgi:hypothetical protein